MRSLPFYFVCALLASASLLGVAARPARADSAPQPPRDTKPARGPTNPDGNVIFGEFGDAPYGVLAYPPSATLGLFPTCVGTPGFVFHGAAPGGSLYLGPSVDYEDDGNHGNCGFFPYDDDECGPGDGDAGLIVPGSYTINPSGNYTLCVGSASAAIGPSCEAAIWGPDLDISALNTFPTTAYLHVLADWNHDGRWDTSIATCPAGHVASEQALLNFPIPSGFSGPVSALSPPQIRLGEAGYAWFRFTLTSGQVAADWDGAGAFIDGETEDYLLLVTQPVIGVGPTAPSSSFAIERAEPNPSGGSTAIVYSVREAGPVQLWIADLAGRRVASLVHGERAAGRQTVVWSGRRDDGRMAGPGVFFVRGESQGVTRSLRITRVR